MTKEEKKEKIQRAMIRNGILDRSDAMHALDFIRDLLNIEIEYTEINESFATVSIREMKDADQRVADLIDVIDTDID